MTLEKQKTPKGSGIIVDDFSPFCEGDIEPQLNKRIHCLIDTDDDYMVYLDDDFFVQWSFTKKFKIPNSFAPIANRIGYLETISRTCLRKSQLEHLARLLAEGMSRIVGDQDEKKASEILDMAESYLKARAEENARCWYLIGSTIAALPTLLIACILWIHKPSTISFLGINTFEVILGTLLGGTGAWFSVLRRAAKIKMDPTAGPLIHYIESACRVLVGNIGAFVMALAVKSNILLGFLKSTNYSFGLLLVVCICAGFSEEILPGFIRRFENSIVSDRKESS